MQVAVRVISCHVMALHDTMRDCAVKLSEHAVLEFSAATQQCTGYSQQDTARIMYVPAVANSAAPMHVWHRWCRRTACSATPHQASHPYRLHAKPCTHQQQTHMCSNDQVACIRTSVAHTRMLRVTYHIVNRHCTQQGPCRMPMCVAFCL